MCPPDDDIKAQVKAMSIKELKAFLVENNVDHADCFEKSDLVKRVELTMNQKKHEHAHSSSSGKEEKTQAQAGATVRSIPVGMLQCNMTIIMDNESKEAVLVDPGGHSEKIIKLIQEMGAKVTHIVITHAHFDHILAAEEVRVHTGAHVHLHNADLQLWKILPMQCAMIGVPPPAKKMPDPARELKHDQVFPLLGARVIHTPGHTPGSCCFYFPGLDLLCSGDTLFKGSVGRTDLPGGNFKQLSSSIQERLYTLPDKTRVIPGHGPETTIEFEKKMNTIVRPSL